MLRKHPSAEAAQTVPGRCGTISAWSPSRRIVVRLIEDALRWVVLLFRSTEALRAENLFLRRQLALYLERGVKPRRIDAGNPH